MAGALAMIGALVGFVMIHEAGHYVAARLTGMKATEFFFGFGPKLWSTQRGETEFGVKALPLGGYVKITGMNALEEVDPADFGRTYREKKYWEKAVVVLAGVVLHFILAYVILFGLFAGFGTQVVLPEVAEVADAETGALSPAAEAGFEAGDAFVVFDGVEVTEWEQLRTLIADRPGERIDAIVDRSGRQVTLTVDLAAEHPNSPGERMGYLGIVPAVGTDSLGIFGAAGAAGQQLVTMTREAYGALFNLIRPSNLVQLFGVFFDGGESLPDEIRPTSPIGIAQIGAQASQIGWQSVLFIMAFLNVFLGILNGLPIYPLDGGHFAVATYERITKREVDVRRLAPIAAAVVILLLFIGLVGIFVDIMNPIDFG